MQSTDDSKTPVCNICGAEGSFIFQEMEREGLLCSNCSASSRHRAVVYVLGLWMSLRDIPLAVWSPNKSIRILESSGRSSYPMILREKFDYYNTEYVPTSPIVQKPFTKYADFQNLSYSDEQFDFVIASDVFEHIREDDKAFHEVYRVLKDDGVFIMTVPYNHEWVETLVRVKPEGDQDVFLLPPEYHGGGGQTLAYRTYGRDLLKRLHEHGFSVGCLEIEVPQFSIGKQFVFVGVKSHFIDLKKFHTPAKAGSGVKGLKASPLILFRVFMIFKYNLFSVRHFMSEIIRKLQDKF